MRGRFSSVGIDQVGDSGQRVRACPAVVWTKSAFDIRIANKGAFGFREERENSGDAFFSTFFSVTKANSKEKKERKSGPFELTPDSKRSPVRSPENTNLLTFEFAFITQNGNHAAWRCHDWPKQHPKSKTQRGYACQRVGVIRLRVAVVSFASDQEGFSSTKCSAHFPSRLSVISSMVSQLWKGNCAAM